MPQSAQTGSQHLTAELEAATLKQVRRTFTMLNDSLFKGLLRAPVLGFSDDKSVLGRWRGETRTLELSRTLLVQHSWGALVEVLKHEMAHQYVDEVLGGADERPHGQVFRRVCEERGVDARAGGVPLESREPTPEGRALGRIAKLLALAESTSRHEAESAMGAAQRLMLKHNIEAALATDQPSYSFRHVGAPSGRVDESQRVLSVILDEFFFVDAIWVPVWRPFEGKRGSVLEICGTIENLESAEYVHAYLSHTAENLWALHKKSKGIRGNTKRRTFLAGVMNGFMQKLENERRTQRKAGLVWRGDAAQTQYFRRRHPYVRRSGHSGRHDHDTYRAGCEAGGRIVLRRAVKQGSVSGPRLLSGNKA